MDPSSPQYQGLAKKLGYQFKDPNNLKLALTHRSYHKQHNERLEYLGDAVLGMVVAEELYKRFPKQPEGKLTRMRSSLVKGETLAEVAKEFELGDLLLLGQGELKSGGFRRNSTLADAVEAIIGAIYLEAGFETTKQLVLTWFTKRLDKLDPEFHPKDHKTRLQEHLQGLAHPLPNYEVTEIVGKDHNQQFHVRCSVDAYSLSVEGSGSSRRKAEQAAAERMLETINEAR